MKKDLWLLAGIGGVVAIALAIAAARGAWPNLRPFNPLEKWSTRQSFFAFAIVLVATLLSIVAIGCNDHDLPQSSALLEWVWSPVKASEVVDAYGAHRLDAIHGLLLDSVAFIPSYVLLIAITSFWIANAGPRSGGQRSSSPPAGAPPSPARSTTSKTPASTPRSAASRPASRRSRMRRVS